LQGALNGSQVRVGGEDNNLGSRKITLDALRNLNSIRAWQMNVHHHNLRPFGLNQIQGCAAVGRLADHA